MARPTNEQQREGRLAAYKLYEAGNTYAQIGKMLNLTKKQAEVRVRGAIELDKLPFLDGASRSFENQNPGIAGEMLATFALSEAMGEDREDKYAALRLAMKEAGLKPTMINGFMKRLRTVFAPLAAEAKRLTTDELTKQIENKLVMTLSYYDEFSVSQMPGKDMAIATKIFVDAHQLLSGKPTMILDHTSRLKIQESLPMLIQEAKRRGITLENPPQSSFAPS